MISIMMNTIRSEGFGFMPTVFTEIGNEDTAEKLHQFLIKFNKTGFTIKLGNG